MKTLVTLICMMVSVYAQPTGKTLKKDIENMDKIERTMRSAPPKPVRGGGRGRR